MTSLSLLILNYRIKKVNKKATKVEIAKAVEKLFEVKVLKVNTMKVNGKKKLHG